MKKFHIILLLLIGFVLMPNSIYACGAPAKKSCCKTEINSDKCKMKCCQKKSNEKSNNGCEGKCGKSSCQIQTISFGAILPATIDVNFNYLLVVNSKQAFYNNKNNISSGFYFIWSPPKIG